MNLEQALAASCHHLAGRQVGDRRVIVDGGLAPMRVHIQRRSRRRWVADDDGGGVRYLAGVMRDGMGRYLCLYPSYDLSDIEQILMLLSTCHQELLSPASDDWHAIGRGDL